MADMHSESYFGLGIRELRYVAGLLAIIVAGIHLLHPRLGAPRLILHLEMGTLFDPRPLVFTASAFLIVFGIVLVYNDVFVRQVYLAGIGLMLSYLVGYVAWHTVLDHGGFWPHLPAHGHYDAGVLETVWIHLAGDTTAMISKILEFVLLIVLVLLYRIGTPSEETAG